MACKFDRKYLRFLILNNQNCAKFNKVLFVLEAISITDLNNDSYLDIVATTACGYIKFLCNQPKARNRFIVFKLKSHRNNIPGIGVTIILYTKNICATCPQDKVVAQFRDFSSFQHASDNQGYINDRIIFGLSKKGVSINVLV